MRKRLFSLLLALAVLFSFAGCAGPKTETKYILMEFETTMFNGFVQKTVHHYDENWVMTGSTVYRDGDVDTEIVYEQNERGDVVSITYTTAGQTQKEEYICTYDEKGNLVQIDTYVDGEKASSTTTERTYDENGVLVSQIQRSEQAIYEHYYNPDGSVAKQVAHILYLDDIQTTEYTYDENGNETRIVVYDASGNLVSETSASYDKDGRILVSVDTSYNENGTPVTSSTSEFTWEGLVKTAHILNTDGTETHRTVTEYDEAGNIIRHEIYSGDQLHNKQVMIYQKVEIPVK